MALTLVRHRFSVDEYERMIEHGILTENDRVELIRGEIIEKNDVRYLQRGQTVDIAALPGSMLAVDDIL